MIETPQNQDSYVASDEISLKEIKRFLALFKKAARPVIIWILVPVAFFGLIGYIAAVTSPKEYDAKCVLITDQVTASASGGALQQGLASLAGVPAPGSASSSDLGADLYPLVISNRPFLIELSKQSIYSGEQKRKLTFEQIFAKKMKVNAVEAFKNMIFHPSNGSSGSDTIITGGTNTDTSGISPANLFFSNDAMVSELTSQNKKMINILGARIKLTQTGKLITLSVKMPEARLSAEATTAVLNLMVKYITKFKTSKQLETVHWLEARTAEAEIKYKTTQQQVAGFKDNNYHVIFESVQSKEALLQNDFTLAAGIYNQLVSQLEQAKIQLKKDTPLFTVVEPVYIPEAISADANKLIISYVSVGILIGLLFVVIILIKTFIRARRQQNIQTIQNRL